MKPLCEKTGVKKAFFVGSPVLVFENTEVFHRFSGVFRAVFWGHIFEVFWVVFKNEAKFTLKIEQNAPTVKGGVLWYFTKINLKYINRMVEKSWSY